MHPTTSNDPIVLRSSSALTTAYVASTPIRIKGFNELRLLLDLSLDTGGGATSANMQIEVANPVGDPAAPAATDWYAITARAVVDPTVASGLAPVGVGRQVLNFSLTDRYEIPLSRTVGKWIRVLVKTTGGPGTSTAAVRLVEGLA